MKIPNSLQQLIQNPKQLIYQFTFTISQQKSNVEKLVLPSLIGCLTYHYLDLYINRNLEFVYDDNEDNRKILSNCKILTKGTFYPTFYLPSAFLQIVWANKCDLPMIPQFRRELFKLPDGGQIALDWMVKENSKNIVVMCHGLTGGTDCNYIKDSMNKLFRAGFTVVCVNQRGVAFSKLTTAKYHKLSDPTDLNEAVNYIQQKFPDAQMYGLGFSKGANLILRYAGLDPSKCKLKAIVSIANPYNLYKCSVNLQKRENKVYQDAITQNFIWLLKFHLEELRPNVLTHGIDIEKAITSTTPEEFDEFITRRLHGYKNVEQLYLDIGCEEYIQNIQIPVICINSKNDPICLYEAIPIEKIKKNKNIILALTKAGCHVEWFSGLIPERWIMSPSIDYLKYISTRDQYQSQTF